MDLSLTPMVLRLLIANVSVSFTPVPNKLAAPVVWPGAGAAP